MFSVSSRPGTESQETAALRVVYPAVQSEAADWASVASEGTCQLGRRRPGEAGRTRWEMWAALPGSSGGSATFSAAWGLYWKAENQRLSLSPQGWHSGPLSAMP